MDETKESREKESKIDIVAYFIAVSIFSLLTAIVFIVEQPIIAATMFLFWALIVALGSHFLSYLSHVHDQSFTVLVFAIPTFLGFCAIIVGMPSETGLIILGAFLMMFALSFLLIDSAEECYYFYKFSDFKWQEMPTEMAIWWIKRILQKVGLAE